MSEADDAAGGEWAAIRLAYIGGDLVEALAMRFGVSQGEIAERVRDENWRRRSRNRAKQRKEILDAMFRIFEGQLADFEIRIAITARQANKEIDMTSKDREMTALANMARTFEKLIELDKAQPGEREEMSEKETAEIRAKLAKRIDQYLNR